jgi:hypothetical protein
MVNRADTALISAVFLATFFVSTAVTYAAPTQDCAAIQRALAASGQPIPGACGQSGDAALFAGGCSDTNPAEAKEFLKTKTGNKPSIEGLQPEFACNLMKFIKAADASGKGKITIGVGTYQIPADRTVANKGVAYCRVMQCKGGTESHPRGIAADIIYNGDTVKPPGPVSIIKCHRNTLCLWAHNNAAKFGLVFRLMPEQGYPQQSAEAWHIELGSGAATASKTSPQSPQSGAPLAGSDKVRELLGAPKQAALDTPLTPSTPKDTSWVNSAFSESAPAAGAPEVPATKSSADTAKDTLTKYAALDSAPESAAPPSPIYVDPDLGKASTVGVSKVFSETPKVPDSSVKADVYFTAGNSTGFDSAGAVVGPSAFQLFTQCLVPFNCPLLSRGEEI